MTLDEGTRQPDLAEPGTAAEAPPAPDSAEALSLSAWSLDDYTEAAARVARAREAEPLNPKHAIRQVLLDLRFGRWGPALAGCQALQESLPGHPLPGYLRALATLRQDEPKRAANIAAEMGEAHPGFGLSKFLQAEAQLRSQFKGLAKLLHGLPADPGYAPAWADLLAKMALSPSPEGARLAAQALARPAALKGSARARELVAQLLELEEADPEAFERRLALQPSGSRAEQVMLLLLHDRIAKGAGGPRAAAEALRGLAEKHPARPAIRRLYAAALTRLAMAEAAEERYPEALRLVERCQSMEPLETIHYQNRAALFSSMRELDSYHDAWLALDRHQIRLALLGKFGPDDAASMAKMHRMFAQQARFQPEAPGRKHRQNLGILMERPRPAAAEPGETTLAVNQDRIAEDPELLRQWIFHRRAELALGHWELGPSPERFLLRPDGAKTARARLEGLASLADSLAVLVPDEGRMLADRMVARWDAWGASAGPSYAQPAEDAEVARLREEHAETIADLALFCLGWDPDGRSPGSAEEVAEFLAAEAPFFDEEALRKALADKDREHPYPLRLLSGYITEALGLDPERKHVLTHEQRRRVFDGLAAELYMRLAYRLYDAHRGHGESARMALEYADRARRLDPDNPRHGLAAARFLLMGRYYDEAASTLAGLRRSARSRDPEILTEIEELRGYLRESHEDNRPGRLREGGQVEAGAGAPAADLAALEAEVERFPTSVQAYEELAAALAARGRMAEAIDLGERAIAQCLAREPQLRARSLSLEMHGLRALSDRDPNVVGLYFAGAHRPALDLIGSIMAADPLPYPVDYVLGLCLLAVNRPDAARDAFGRALGRCDRQLHRAVLRGLAEDVDAAYLAVARRSIQDKLDLGAFAEASREAAEVMGRLRRPESALVDLARVAVLAADAHLGTAAVTPAPKLPEVGGLSSPLADCFAAPTELARARRLVALGLERDEAGRKPLEALLRKLVALERQASIAETLARFGALFREGSFDAALAALDGLGAAGESEPRVLRQRALLLLKLERFDEAEAVARTLAAQSSPAAREFSGEFPALAFRQRMSAANRLIRAGDPEAALRLLEPARATSAAEALDLAYGRGFAHAMAAYRLRGEGRPGEAGDRLHAAIGAIEPHVPAARSAGHARLLELYAKLDKDLDA
jgi:hypothetical protein